MSNFSSKLSRVRSVKKLSAFTHRHRSPSPNPPSSPPPSRTSTASEELPSSNTRSDYGNMARHSLPRSRTISAAGRTTSTTNSFGETLRAMSREAQNGEFADVFGSFFFNDKRCQNRAFFMAARLKQTLQTMITPIRQPTPALASPAATPPMSQRYPSNSNNSNQQLWEMMTHRLYTLNYILFVLPPTCEIRSRFLAMLEQQLGQIGDGQQVLRRGGMEVHFVVRYVMKHYWQRRRTLVQFHQDDDDDDIEEIVERAREVMEHCLESESKLGHAERDAMYVFHGLRMGLHGTFEPRIELDEDPELKHRLLMTVQENKQVTKQAYVNPFEDADAIVTEDDDDLAVDDMVPSREVDSGFYDHFAPSTRAAAFS
ncbi:hypothetical protein K492DRAFT_172638 [Lichtheimia hyalospora FSU 10163]|nr:hypothetical protein K492DRAFT_172638 [Lichtheimia hyalospora FSU 10163]